MLEGDSPKPKLSPDDITRLRRGYQLLGEHNGQFLFPSGRLLVADPFELAYPTEIADSLILPIHDNESHHNTPFQFRNWERFALLEQGMLYLPSADGGYYVYDDPQGVIHIENNFDNPEALERARFETHIETATLLIGDLDTFKGDVNFTLPPRQYWPYEDYPKIPSTVYGQVIEVSPSDTYRPDLNLTGSNRFHLRLTPVKAITNVG